MSTLDVAVAALGVNSALTTGALVYTVRRVSPWPRLPVPAAAPKPPAQQQPASTVPPGGTT